MGRRVVPLSAKQVDRRTYGRVLGQHQKHQTQVNDVGTPRTAYHPVGGEGCDGLSLMCQPPKREGDKKGSRSWILRISIDGKQCQLGLGSYPAVSLARAREKARELRSMVADGIDPREAKRQARADREAAQRRRVTFEELTAEYMAKRLEESGALSAEKKIQKEHNQIRRYAFDVLGRKIVADITPSDVAEAIRRPLEDGKKETFHQIRRNISRAMSMAKARGLYQGDNPAELRVLQDLLPTPKGKKKTLAKPKHQPSVMLADVQRFYSTISNDHSVGARLLQWQMLTATRPGEARHARWSDIDLERSTWTIPAELMKQGVEHDVPLPEAAVELLRALPRDGEYLFGIKPPSENTASKRLKVLHQKDIDAGGKGFVDSHQLGTDGEPRTATPHGLRSTFKEWARLQSAKYRDELSELALAHQEGSKVRSAYARSKQLEERRPMMADWAAYIDSRAVWP